MCVLFYIFIMDDYKSGPSNFNLIFDSKDDSVSGQPGNYIWSLRKNLDFAGDFEITISEIIIKHSFNLKNFAIKYNNNEDNLNEFKIAGLNIDNIANSHELINAVNNSLPENLQKLVNISLTDNNFVVVKIKDVQIKFPDLLSKILGFDGDKFYPDKPVNTATVITGAYALNTKMDPIFYVLLDIVEPKLVGSKSMPLILTEIFVSDNYKKYKYIENNENYNKIIRNYISLINIKIVDTSGNIIPIDNRLIIRFNIRKA